MTIATISTKGKVTIPKKIRDKLHLQTGDKIDIILEEDGSARILPLSNSIDSIIGIVKTNKKLSPSQMNKAIAQTIKVDK